MIYLEPTHTLFILYLEPTHTLFILYLEPTHTLFILYLELAYTLMVTMTFQHEMEHKDKMWIKNTITWGFSQHEVNYMASSLQ